MASTEQLEQYHAILRERTAAYLTHPSNTTAAGDSSPNNRLKALGLGMKVHTDKATLLLGIPPAEAEALSSGSARTGKLPDPDHFRAHHDLLQSLVMAAATDRQFTIETAMLQCLRATASHIRLAQDDSPDAAAFAVCHVCGHIETGAPPDRCPICRATRDQFTVIG